MVGNESKRSGGHAEKAKPKIVIDSQVREGLLTELRDLLTQHSKALTKAEDFIGDMLDLSDNDQVPTKEQKDLDVFMQSTYFDHGSPAVQGPTGLPAVIEKVGDEIIHKLIDAFSDPRKCGTGKQFGPRPEVIDQITRETQQLIQDTLKTELVPKMPEQLKPDKNFDPIAFYLVRSLVVDFIQNGIEPQIAARRAGYIK